MTKISKTEEFRSISWSSSIGAAFATVSLKNEFPGEVVVGGSAFFTLIAFLVIVAFREGTKAVIRNSKN